MRFRALLIIAGGAAFAATFLGGAAFFTGEGFLAAVAFFAGAAFFARPDFLEDAGFATAADFLAGAAFFAGVLEDADAFFVGAFAAADFFAGTFFGELAFAIWSPLVPARGPELYVLPATRLNHPGRAGDRSRRRSPRGGDRATAARRRARSLRCGSALSVWSLQ